MANLIMTMFQVLLAESAGVGIVAAVLYLYWNLMTNR